MTEENESLKRVAVTIDTNVGKLAQSLEAVNLTLAAVHTALNETNASSTKLAKALNWITLAGVLIALASMTLTFISACR